jgi:hypothetical protein
MYLYSLYMAKDHRFYKRVGNIVQAMEQYEVIDVMNRTRAASLATRIQLRQSESPYYLKDWTKILLDISVTSNNFVSSEYGALKLTLVKPIDFGEGVLIGAFRSGHHEAEIGFPLEGYEDTPWAESLMMRWGAHTGTIIFPDDWFNFYNNAFVIHVPNPELIADPIYLFQIELFTTNSRSKKQIYELRLAPDNLFEVLKSDEIDYSDLTAAFWRTYHAAIELKSQGRLSTQRM